MQLIFVVETNKRVQTDVKYIGFILENAYEPNNVKIKYLYLGGKRNYQSDAIKKQIKREIKKYEEWAGLDTKIIYFIDTDRIGNNQQDMNSKIVKYCDKNKYDLVWFNTNVEDVFLNKKIKPSKKKERALKFFRTDKIKDVELLQEPNPLEKRRSSNILCILDIYLPRKK